MDDAQVSDRQAAVEHSATDRFQRTLDRELLISLRLRATMLAVLIGVAMLFMGGLIVYLARTPGPPSLPTIVPVVAGSVFVYELAMRHVIGRWILREHSPAAWVWYLNSFIEMSLITVVVVVVFEAFDHPVYALLTPPVAVYFFFIVLSILNLDFKVSVFAGLVAGLEYLACTLYALSLPPPAGIDPMFATAAPYVARVFIIIGAGVAAALISKELYRRMTVTFRATEERDRVRVADRLKSRFLADVSHEIRTPLNTILGYVQLLGSDGDLTPRQAHAIRTIGGSGDHLLAVLNEVLDLTKIESGREELRESDFDLGGMAEELATIFEPRCRRKNLEWRSNVDTAAGRVHGDTTKLRQVLTNLLENAVSLTDSGHVDFSVRPVAGGRYRFEVADSGPGISAAEQRRIFEPFRQAEQRLDRKGAGLGLAIASRQVTLMGGDLEVVSTPGSETRFHFELVLPPASTSNVADDKDPWSRVTALAPGDTVDALIVDDLAANRDVLNRMLERVGATVREAASGEEALAALEARRSDVVFMDIRMPELSGPQAVRRMRARYPGGATRYVAVSASALEHEQRAYLDAGFDAFIEKPVRMQRVYACLAELLGVSYVYRAASDAAAPEMTSANLAKIVLPGALLDALRTAIERHNMTELRRRLDDVEALGGDPARLAAHLRALSRRYDLETMLTDLNEVSHD